MNFRQYLERRLITNDASGNFIRDARADSSLPENPTSWTDLKAYLEGKGSNPEALRAAHRVFKSFRDYASRLKQREPVAAVN